VLASIREIHDILPTLPGRICVDQILHGGRYIILDDAGGRHRIWLQSDAGSPDLTFHLPMDRSFDMRSDATTRFTRRSRGLTAGARSPSLPSAFQRHRLTLMIRLADAEATGASLRDLARIVAPAMPVMSAAAWKASSERRHIQRLRRETAAMIAGGYRALLTGATKTPGETSRSPAVCHLRHITRKPPVLADHR
jgi:hypothetical protein